MFVLFLRELGLPAGQIGILLSLFPFCGLVALFFAPAAARLGRKRVFMACYGMRKLIMAMMLFLPWVVSRWGQGAAGLFVAGIITVFAVLRALAETAYYPWAQEFIPNRVRGKFSAWSSVLALLVSGCALAIAGAVLERGTGLDRYLLLIATGSVIGLIGVGLMAKVPGGMALSDDGSRVSYRTSMAAALRDRNFTRYLGAIACQTLGTTLLVSFLPLFLSEAVRLTAAQIMRLDLIAMAVGALASLGVGWFSDRVGSRPVLIPSAALLALVPLGWLLIANSLPAPAPYVLFLLFGVANNGVIIGASRLLYNGVVPAAQNTAYMAIYYAWIGVAGGVAPLLGGAVLHMAAVGDRNPADGLAGGYSVLFGLALLFLGASYILYGRVRRDGIYSTRTVFRSFLRRLAWR